MKTQGLGPLDVCQSTRLAEVSRLCGDLYTANEPQAFSCALCAPRKARHLFVIGNVWEGSYPQSVDSFIQISRLCLTWCIGMCLFTVCTTEMAVSIEMT